MRISIPYLIIAALAALSAFSPGCKPTVNEGDTIVNIPQPTEEAVSLTSQGWAFFEQKDYAQAASLFLQATQKNNVYPDAYNGLGWTYARLDSMSLAKHYFDVALGLNPAFVDAYAGRSFVSLALDEYRDAIAAVQEVMAIGPSFYAFRHDATISLNDLLLVQAQSYFMLGDYESTQTLIDRLDPTNRLDVTSPTYIEDLSLEIENLRGRI